MTENQQQTREQTPDEQFRMLFDRTAKLNDAVSALLAPKWGSENGIIPSDHPLYVGEKAVGGEQAAPVDWQAIAERRERELKTVGEARHTAEATIERVRAQATAQRARGASGSTDHKTGLYDAAVAILAALDEPAQD